MYSDEKIPDKPRNVIGIAKTIPAPEMEQLILKNLAVTPDDLRALANARATAVRNHLETHGQGPARAAVPGRAQAHGRGHQGQGSAHAG